MKYHELNPSVCITFAFENWSEFSEFKQSIIKIQRETLNENITESVYEGNLIDFTSSDEEEAEASAKGVVEVTESLVYREGGMINVLQKNIENSVYSINYFEESPIQPNFKKTSFHIKNQDGIEISKKANFGKKPSKQELVRNERFLYGKEILKKVSAAPVKKNILDITNVGESNSKKNSESLEGWTCFDEQRRNSALQLSELENSTFIKIGTGRDDSKVMTGRKKSIIHKDSIIEIEESKNILTDSLKDSLEKKNKEKNIEILKNTIQNEKKNFIQDQKILNPKEYFKIQKIENCATKKLENGATEIKETRKNSKTSVFDGNASNCSWNNISSQASNRKSGSKKAQHESSQKNNSGQKRSSTIEENRNRRKESIEDEIRNIKNIIKNINNQGGEKSSFLIINSLSQTCKCFKTEFNERSDLNEANTKNIANKKNKKSYTCYCIPENQQENPENLKQSFNPEPLQTNKITKIPEIAQKTENLVLSRSIRKNSGNSHSESRFYESTSSKFEAIAEEIEEHSDSSLNNDTLPQRKKSQARTDSSKYEELSSESPNFDSLGRWRKYSDKSNESGFRNLGHTFNTKNPNNRLKMGKSGSQHSLPVQDRKIKRIFSKKNLGPSNLKNENSNNKKYAHRKFPSSNLGHQKFNLGHVDSKNNSKVSKSPQTNFDSDNKSNLEIQENTNLVKKPRIQAIGSFEYVKQRNSNSDRDNFHEWSSQRPKHSRQPKNLPPVNLVFGKLAVSKKKYSNYEFESLVRQKQISHLEDQKNIANHSKMFEKMKFIREKSDGLPSYLEETDSPNFNKKFEKSGGLDGNFEGRDRIFSEEVASVPEEGWVMMENKEQSIENEKIGNGSNYSSGILNSSFQEIRTRF